MLGIQSSRGFEKTEGRTWKLLTQSSLLKSLNYSMIVFPFPCLEENVALDTLLGLHTWVSRTNIWLFIFCFYNAFKYHGERGSY